ncbi:hypothetical protein HZR84_11480 [Hyphobacterium sp. CCMP332]|nr:hypothetical protein HZR84_11480 [Hyphobacterium sp. CCMP332]
MSKTINLFLSLLALSFAVSCNSNDDAVGGQPIVQNDSSLSSGKLIVNVVDVNNNPVSGVIVTLHGTLEDLEKGIWLYNLLNDNRGEVDFGFINLGNYYIYAEENGGARRNNAPGDAAQVRSQQITPRTVVIR